MSTATTQQDDDLLIIADDDHSEDTIEFSFDEPSVEATKEASKAVTETSEVSIENTAEVESNISLETVQSETSVLDSVEKVTEAEITPKEAVSDDSFDLFEDNSAPREEASTEVKEEENTLSSDDTGDFSFDLGESEDASKQEVSTEDNTKEETMKISLWEDIVEAAWSGDGSTASGDDSSMNDILSATIAKLEARKTHIAEAKTKKLKHEDEIKSQIKALEAEHASIEAELTGLDSESDKIVANITELENMKLDPVKDHNSKRAKK